jgi:hypothetical protein
MGVICGQMTPCSLHLQLFVAVNLPNVLAEAGERLGVGVETDVSTIMKGGFGNVARVRDLWPSDFGWGSECRGRVA